MKNIGMEPTAFTNPQEKTGFFVGVMPTNSEQQIIDISIMNTTQKNSRENQMLVSDIYEAVMRQTETKLGSRSWMLEQLHDGDFFKKWLTNELNTEEGITQQKINWLVKRMQTNGSILTTQMNYSSTHNSDAISDAVWSGVGEVWQKRKNKNQRGIL